MLDDAMSKIRKRVSESYPKAWGVSFKQNVWEGIPALSPRTNKRVFFVYSEDALKTVESTQTDACNWLRKITGKTGTSGARDISIDASEDLTFSGYGFDLILALGGRRAINAGKGIACANGIPCIAMPSCFDSIDFSTDKIGRDTAYMPEGLVLDYELIAKAGDMNLGAMMQVLSIRNALNEHKESGETDSSAEHYIEHVLWQISHQKTDPEVMMPVYVMTAYLFSGEEGKQMMGSEYLFADLMQAEVPELSYSICLFWGLIVLSYLKGNDITDILEQIDGSGILSQLVWNPIHRAVISDVLDAMNLDIPDSDIIDVFTYLREGLHIEFKENNK